jgi:predicted DNA-binding transcriptional regulator AlpA
MQIGYARVSTKEQSFDLQVDALRKAGCEKVYQEVVSDAKAERPVLDGLLQELRTGDVLVIWKLDRLGRSLRHLVDLAATLLERDVGLKSLSDPIDTTTPQGRLTFNLLASLAEFEKDLMRERTQAGLSAARARGRKGDAPKDSPRRPNGPPTRPRPCIASSACQYERSPRNSASPRARSTSICATAAYRSAGSAKLSRLLDRAVPSGFDLKRRQLPSEALIDLRRRLADLAPRSAERRLIMKETAALYGISESSLYRALRERARPKRRRCSAPTVGFHGYCPSPNSSASARSSPR